jgi:hypothetical protein
MKTIPIEHWDPPEFRVRIKNPQNCPKLPRRRRLSYMPVFRAIQSEPQFARSRGRFRRIVEFTEGLAHHAF